MFHGFFAENGGLVEESCAPYDGFTGVDGNCGSFSSCKEVARVSKSYKVGKTVEDIQKEIMMNGMVEASVDMPSGHSLF